MEVNQNYDHERKISALNRDYAQQPAVLGYGTLSPHQASEVDDAIILEHMNNICPLDGEYSILDVSFGLVSVSKFQWLRVIGNTLK